ncbi:ROK family protein [Bosea sp. PAMC 26642]|uniref:ROK family protein n=1 Tax=Bosea sp. (strain PAMC 26642) TaxID=1792307 RepID=UPI0007704FC4|nr:glucokinase [Bosea sp. PAMC 26642]
MGMAKGDRMHGHGTSVLPAATVENYNFDVKHQGEILNNRVRKGAFLDKLEGFRQDLRRFGADPMGDLPTADLSKKQLGSFLNGEEPMAAAIVQTAVDEFSNDIADVLQRFLKDKNWSGVERIVVGGGFKEGIIGERTIAAASLRLKSRGIGVDLAAVRQHPDEAGLIGTLHLMPSWMFKGHDAILAADIGGSNIRAGVVLPQLKDAKDLSKASVWKSDLWRHADENVRRTKSVDWLVDALKDFISRAEKDGLSLAPFIGIGCPGVIEADGTISRGGMNLPGGNWDDKRFNLPKVLAAAIPKIADHDTIVVMHNDAVVQGMSQRPFMSDVKRWAAITIGTGLGNASFTNTAE